MAENIENNNQPADKKEAPITIRDIVDFVLFNWYWFALSIIVFIGLGVAYALSRQPVYRSSAMILVDEKYNRSSNSDITTGFMPGSTMFRPNSGVEDELLIMGSRTIMEQVVQDLDANIWYSSKGRFRAEPIYAPDAPVRLFADTIRMPYAVRIQQIDGDRFTAALEYRLPGARRKSVRMIEATFGETIRDTTVGVFRILQQHMTVEPQGKGEIVTVAVVPVRNVAENYARRLNVAQAQKMSDVVNVSFNSNLPQQAAEVVNRLIAVYNQDAMETKRETARATLNFIDERLQSVAVELGDVDAAIERFKSQNSAVDITYEAGLSLQTVRDYENQLLATEIQIEMLNAIAEILESDSVGILPVNIGIQDQALSSAIDQYNELIIEKMRLGPNISDNNPIIKDINTQISSMQSALKESFNALRIQQESLQKQLSRITQKVHTIPSLERETVSIERDQEVKATLYAFLLNKREETALSLVATTPVAQVIDAAIVDPQPVAPRRSLIVLIFMIIGALLPAVIIYLIEQMRTKVSSVGEVEKTLQVPIIGAIPSKTSGMHDDKIVAPNSRDVITEAFRMVRTNLDFTMPQGGKVIMVTSSLPGEGKSFV